MIPFVKLQGLGNDFILIDDLGKPVAMRVRLGSELARELCDRRLGIGADQVLWLKSAAGPDADARMEIFNADGSVAEMCGNGIRALALYLYRHGPQRQPSYRIETLAGVRETRIIEFGENGSGVSVDMGSPVFGAGDELLSVPGFSGRFLEVNVGNPHAVFVVPAGTLDGLNLAEFGPLIENLPRFPLRTNVELIEITGPSSLRCRVWERGAGLTLACGTGACAAAAAALRQGLVQGPVEVSLPGGKLEIRWTSGQPIWMLGPAEEVFRGEFQQRA